MLDEVCRYFIHIKRERVDRSMKILGDELTSVYRGYFQLVTSLTGNHTNSQPYWNIIR